MYQSAVLKYNFMYLVIYYQVCTWETKALFAFALERELMVGFKTLQTKAFAVFLCSWHKLQACQINICLHRKVCALLHMRTHGKNVSAVSDSKVSDVFWMVARKEKYYWRACSSQFGHLNCRLNVKETVKSRSFWINLYRASVELGIFPNPCLVIFPLCDLYW